MRKYKALTPALVLGWLSSAAYGGGTIGGTGTLERVDVLKLMSGPLTQPDLGLEKIMVPADEFRRARSRLSVFDETTLLHDGEPLAVTKRSGGITDTKGLRQVMPEVEAQ